MQLTAFDNGFAERLIGSIRRECLDHIIVLGEAHLSQILKSYANYYNGVRTHRSCTHRVTGPALAEQIGDARAGRDGRARFCEHEAALRDRRQAGARPLSDAAE